MKNRAITVKIKELLMHCYEIRFERIYRSNKALYTQKEYLDFKKFVNSLFN